MVMKIIAAFSQLAGGKDSSCDYLVKKLNEEAIEKWQRIGFAYAVKKVFMDTFEVSWEFIEEWKRKEEVPEGFNMPIRKCLQFIGDGFRQIQSNIWIKLVLRNKFPIVISDGRYINEARIIKESGGINFLIYRPGFENDDPNPSESQIKSVVQWCANQGEEGEIKKFKNYNSAPEEVKLFDWFLKNDGDLSCLYSKIDEMLIPFVNKFYDA
jgi:hypothetical protein